MLQNEGSFPKVGIDTVGNELSKICQNFDFAGRRPSLAGTPTTGAATAATTTRGGTLAAARQSAGRGGAAAA